MSKSDRFFSPTSVSVDGEVLEFLGQAINDQYKRNDWVEEYEFGPSLTRQDMAPECDINTIMAKYQVTGILPIKEGTPRYVDFATVPDNLMESMAQLHLAEEQFMRLPAHVRREFDNDPVLFVEFASDPENLDQLREWDLAPKKAPEAPQAPLASTPPDQAPAPKVEPAPAPRAPTQ